MSQSPWIKTLPDKPFEQAKVIKLAASAGCGKTYTINKTIDDLLNSGVSPSSIMYVVFNKRTASEFRARFPLSKDDMRWWETHHSINLNLLNRSPSHGRKEVMPPGGKRWTEFGALHGYEFSSDEDDEVAEGTRILGEVSRKLYSTEKMEDDETRFLSRLTDFERENECRSYLTMMFDALDANLFPPGIRFVFVDEAQDNGKAQNDYWLRMLERHPEIEGFMLAGDDKQAINGYKGGDAEGFLSFPADMCVSLGASYRCPKPVLDLANGIAGPIANRSPLIDESKASASGSVDYARRFHETTDVIRKYVAARKPVLILSRTKKVRGIAFGAVIGAGLPVHSEPGDRIRRIFRAFKDMKETGMVTAQETAVLNPNRSTSERSSDGDLKISCPYFDKAFRKSHIKDTDLTASQMSYLEEANDMPSGSTPLQDSAKLGFTDLFIKDVFSGKGPDVSYFYGGAKVVALAESVSRWVSEFGTDYAAVNALTIHGAKGGEAPLVVLLTDMSRTMANNERENIESERRVWYTAVTRSLDKIIVTRIVRRVGHFGSYTDTSFL